MKIIIQSNIHTHVLKLVVALQQVKAQCFIWDSRAYSLYDLIIEQNPDVLITNAQVTQEIVSAVESFNIKLVIADDLENVEKVFKVIRPFGLLLTKGWAYVNNTPTVYIDECADCISMKQKQPVEKIYDLTYLSDNTSLSFEHLCHLNLFCYPNNHLKFRVIGPVGINLVSYVGNPQPNSLIEALHQSCIVLDFNKLHLLDYAANGIFSIGNVQNDYYPYYNSSDDLIELVNQYLSSDRTKIVADAKQKVIDNKLTNYHKASELCNMLGAIDLSKKLIECIV